MSERRSQASRRAETQARVLASATQLFGDKGYAATSLEDIAGDCGISIAPIYHYFGNKKKLFKAVNEAMEASILAPSVQADSIEPEDTGVKGDPLLSHWRGFLTLCREPAFRQIVLIDGPNVLGLDRMSHGQITSWVLERMRQRFQVEGASDYKGEILGRMLMGALAEAGLFIGHAEDPEQASRDAEELVASLVAMLKQFE